MDARQGRRRPGRTLTSYPSVRTDIRNAGGTVVDQEVVTDQNITSSRWPDDLPAFCARIVEQFATSGTGSVALACYGKQREVRTMSTDKQKEAARRSIEKAREVQSERAHGEQFRLVRRA